MEHTQYSLGRRVGVAVAGVGAGVAALSAGGVVSGESENPYDPNFQERRLEQEYGGDWDCDKVEARGSVDLGDSYTPGADVDYWLVKGSTIEHSSEDYTGDFPVTFEGHAISFILECERKDVDTTTSTTMLETTTTEGGETTTTMPETTTTVDGTTTTTVGETTTTVEGTTTTVHKTTTTTLDGTTTTLIETTTTLDDGTTTSTTENLVSTTVADTTTTIHTTTTTGGETTTSTTVRPSTTNPTTTVRRNTIATTGGGETAETMAWIAGGALFSGVALLAASRRRRDLA